MDIKTAVIYRLNDLIKQKDITVNEAAVRSGVPPSTLKNILYGQSRNAGVVTIKKICDTILGIAELSFDLSVFDIFSVLGVGGTLVLPNPEKGPDASHWGRLLNEYKVTLEQWQRIFRMLTQEEFI